MTGGACNELAAFQDAFAAALRDLGTPTHPLVASLASQPGFAVYRNGVLAHAIDALQASFPAIVRLVGETWFRAAAREFVLRTPPRTPLLLDYGAEFSDFLASFEPAAEMPYLADVARLDRLWTEAHTGPDEDALSAAWIAACSPEALHALVLRPHPCARWAWFTSGPIHTIWERNRYGDPTESELPWHAEGAVLGRAFGRVESARIGAGGFSLLEACARGAALGKAVDAALAADPSTNFQELMLELLRVQAFTGADLDEES